MQAKGGTVLITADHGNAEKMMDADGKPHTAHTTNQVPLILLAGPGRGGGTLANGILADIAPTILDIMGIPQPGLMTGHSLIVM
jgi:2,3-bisphosphoglycerate-independent phosphoglycerate mutase